ncbi:LPS assembly lipoprotein LptE [Parvicella tangerina]|uniref:Uncharacterized protein n=1 Tax=Parvicella tangerina TaxID=2829795 RepID=A0A916JK72_9FLAO|nr:LptE family protein [Parvicella tangerina]CAG5077203.1 hypothetical protein CRYO30217_00318 [Parvicella tangerina]
MMLTQCKLPSFSLKPGGKTNDEVPGETVQVDFFENRSTLASSNAAIVLTEGIRDIVLTQSKKELVAESGDWVIEGVIRDYQIKPIAIQAGSEDAAQNRLTMTVQFSWDYQGEDRELLEDSTAYELEGIDQVVSSFVDYDSASDFAAVEDELLTELVRQLSQDIYDVIFGGKW